MRLRGCAWARSPQMSRYPCPQLRIQRGGVLTTGVRTAGTWPFSFMSRLVQIDGSCVFSGQPYRYATSFKFPDDCIVPQSDDLACHSATAAQLMPLIYDHCKNHPQWFDTKTLKGVASAGAQAGAIDSLKTFATSCVCVSWLTGQVLLAWFHARTLWVCTRPLRPTELSIRI